MKKPDLQYMPISSVRPGSTVETELTKMVMLLVYTSMGSAIVKVSKSAKCFGKLIEHKTVERVSLSTQVRVLEHGGKDFNPNDELAKLEVNTGSGEPIALQNGDIKMPQAKKAKAETPAKPIKVVKPTADNSEKIAKAQILEKITKRGEALIKENELTYAQIHTKLKEEFGDAFDKSVSWLGNLGYYLKHPEKRPSKK